MALHFSVVVLRLGVLCQSLLAVCACIGLAFESLAQSPSGQAVGAGVTKSVVLLRDMPKPTAFSIPSLPRIKGKPCLRHFVNYNTEDGLALSGIYCGLKDRDNNLWFGSLGGGVSKFDGKSFTNFGGAQGLPHGVVRAIVQDKAGALYFGTGVGLSVYDGINLRNYTADDGMPGGAVSCMIIDNSGLIWIGTLGGGLASYDGKKFNVYSIEHGLPSNTIRSLEVDKGGILWIGTMGGVSTFDGERFHKISLGDFKEPIVYDIHCDGKGHLWFAGAEGVTRYDHNQFIHFTTHHGLAGNRVLSIGENDHGTLWFGTHENGVSRYDEGRFETLTKEEGLPSNRIWAIIKDGSGNLWFCSQGEGIALYSGDAVCAFRPAQGLAHGLVWSIVEDLKANLWIGTDDGISYYDGEYFTNITAKHGLPVGLVSALGMDSTGVLWAGTNGGLSRWDGKKLNIYSTPQGLADSQVSELIVESPNSIWLATAKGISRFDGERFENFTLSPSPFDLRPRCLYLDRQRALWIGTARGLFKYHHGQFLRVDVPAFFPPFVVTSIVQDKNGFFWLGSHGQGLLRYDGNSFKRISFAQGLPNEVIYDLDIDPLTGHLWIGSNAGLTKLSFADGEAEIIPAGVLKLNNDSINAFRPVYTQFNRHTGYPLEDLNNGAMFVTAWPLNTKGRSAKSIVWAGFGDGKLIRLDPSAAMRDAKNLALEIRTVQLNGRNIPWTTLKNRGVEPDSLVEQQETFLLGQPLTNEARDSLLKQYSEVKFASLTPFTYLPEKLSLPASVNNITFDFHAIEPSRNFLISYQYRLVGLSNSWSYPSKKADATFTNLWEGDYKFEVRAQDASGAWTEPVAFSFDISPPWWRTWFMYVVYSLALVFLVMGVIKIRERRLQDEKQRLEKLIEERTREVNVQKEEALRQKKIVEERNKEIQSQLEQTEKDLTNQTLDMIHRQNLFNEIQGEIERLSHEKHPSGLQKLATLVNVNKTLEKEWYTFNQYFTSVHRDFYEKLRDRAPSLSVYEERLSALIRMRMDNRQIATLLAIEVSSVKMAKYRLKKKLQLDESEDLQQYLSLL
ncbi:MAG TPA: two-component regulator propeller domain-containing protein [Chryseosolibacter sp.]